MYKLPMALALCAAFAAAQTQSDPESASKKTAERQGYHIVSPKNTGPTSPESKQQDDKDKADKDRKSRGKDGLQDQAPPTSQPNVKPPGKT